MLRKSCGISIVQSSELYKPLETTRLYARPAGLAATIGLNFQQTTLISDHTVWLWAVRCHGNRRLSEFTGPSARRRRLININIAVQMSRLFALGQSTESGWS